MIKKEESVLLSREQCPACASRGRDNSMDNLAIYDDGHVYCFSCGYFKQQHIIKESPMTLDTTAFKTGTVCELPHRGIKLAACKAYNYQTIIGSSMELEDYMDPTTKQLKAQHVRKTDKKDFFWSGDTKDLTFYGQHLFSGGPRLCITEGAIDCLTMAQLFDNKYPVVSIPNGVKSASQAVKTNYEFLTKFETIVLCFDMDEAGQKAAREVAELLPPGRVLIMNLPKKDANETLLEMGAAVLTKCYWNAKPFSPDNILTVSDILEQEEDIAIYEYPWDSLTCFMTGQDAGRLNLWTSAPGQGKSSVIRELVMSHINNNIPVGCVFLEESPDQTINDLVSLMIGKPVKLILGQRKLTQLRNSMGKDPFEDIVCDDLTIEETNAARKILATKPLYIYDHLGRHGVTNIINRLEYMTISLGCKVLIIDHITLLGNMMMNTGSSDERLILDEIMKNLRSLVERTGVTIHVVSHIKKTDRTPEEGSRVMLNDLRGSGSLAQIADYVFALERNRQHTDALISNTTIVRVLKNRKSGRSGVASALFYNHKTSRLVDVAFKVNETGELLYDHTAAMR
jgi:twinkle protein